MPETAERKTYSRRHFLSSVVAELGSTYVSASIWRRKK